jgi:hypothetical protein
LKTAVSSDEGFDERPANTMRLNLIDVLVVLAVLAVLLLAARQDFPRLDTSPETPPTAQGEQ